MTCASAYRRWEAQWNAKRVLPSHGFPIKDMPTMIMTMKLDLKTRVCPEHWTKSLLLKPESHRQDLSRSLSLYLSPSSSLPLPLDTSGKHKTLIIHSSSFAIIWQYRSNAFLFLSVCRCVYVCVSVNAYVQTVASSEAKARCSICKSAQYDEMPLGKNMLFVGFV